MNILNGEYESEDSISDQDCFEPDSASSRSSDDQSMIDSATEKRNSLDRFLALCNSRHRIKTTMSYGNLKRQSKANFLVPIRNLLRNIIHFVAPNDFDEIWQELLIPDTSNKLFLCVCLNEYHIVDAEELSNSKKLIPVMHGITEAYENAESSSERRTILSMVAPNISFSLLQIFIPGVTYYRFIDARMFSRRVKAGFDATTGPRVSHRFDDSQVQHFIDFIISGQVCTDMPFGEKMLKLSDGTKLRVPDTIRNCDSSRIIMQYYQYSSDLFPDFPVLGQSSLYKILHECKASSRKSVQGLNYFVANASEAFDILHEVVKNLHLNSNENLHLINGLKRAKHYLKTDFKVNVKRCSRVADHCIAYSLSDANAIWFSRCCDDHDHDKVCLNCCHLTQVLKDVNDSIDIVHLNQEEKERLKHTVYLANQSIQAWKSHQLRSINQDLGRQCVLDILPEDSIYLNMDFAMK